MGSQKYFSGIISTLILILVSIFYFRPQPIGTLINSTSPCEGTFNGTVEKVIDGDTLSIVGCSRHIRLSLVNAPETYESGYEEAKNFTSTLCPVGSIVTVNQDEMQPFDTYDRIVALVQCQGKNLNAELFNNHFALIEERYCSKSEFANEDWAKSSCFG